MGNIPEILGEVVTDGVINNLQVVCEHLKSEKRDREYSIVITKIEESIMWLIHRRDRIACEEMIVEIKEDS